ncbi:MAG: metallophosphoesterase [Ilumatobacteraceae bacterium]
MVPRSDLHDRSDLRPRNDLAPVPAGRGTTVARLGHLSDLHVLDSASPMRFEWIETLAHDPRWRPLLHMHRPQEALVPWAVARHVDEMRDEGSLDLVVCTGDNIDNAQRNELDVYLGLVAGGEVALPAWGGPNDAGAEPAVRPWPYWSPRGDVDDLWTPRGYPTVDDLLERMAEPIVSAGWGMPWTSLPGNHDLMCQGTSYVNDALHALAVGGHKALLPPVGFAPDDVLARFVDAPEDFVGIGTRTIEADPRRRGITLGEWIDAHAAAGARGWDRPAPTGRADTVVHLDGLTVVVLDTNHPHADYQGSVGLAQLAWLDDRLRLADDNGHLVVIASHHGPDSLVTVRGDDPGRVLAGPLLDVVHRHPCVVLWLTGHRHVHRITPRPGAAGGFWEITTASIIDWPSERRVVEVARHADGTIEIATEVRAHDAPGGSLARWHRDVARRFGGSQVRSKMAGSDVDRDVRLFVAR